jgi:DNA-binding CsgD family transcriptional regulator
MAWMSIAPRTAIEARQVAMLVDHLDDDLFDATLLDMFHEIAPVAEVNGFSLEDQTRDPRPVGWCGLRAGTARRVERYTQGFYRLDPTLQSLPATRQRRDTLVHILAAESVGNDVYRRTCFEEPSFSQKVSIAQGGCNDPWTIMNIYFGEPCSRSSTIQQVVDFGLLVAPFLRRRAAFPSAIKSMERVDDRLDRRLQRRFPLLTPRERRVCALTMIGKSSGEIATTLGIRPGTVLTYRRRAYERLGVSSAAALVAEIL